ncbi:ATP-binding protein, partial [Corallococcus exiguus]|uniref:ATP-binding protein n=1 Tax=Corallococcus exiguus TaxID=83462 RepID=UPI0020164235
MRILFGIQPSVDASHARDRVATSLARIGPNLDGTYELICEFLGIAENAASSALAPKTRHAYLLDVMSHLIRDRGKSPLVILFEDLHWLDEASEGFVETICTAISGTQVLLIVNYRPNYS